MAKNKLSVVLATRNEESNIGPCLESVKRIADEIIVMDENSTDRTRDIAKKLGAKVYKVKHEPIFHKTKQKALDCATGDWILQLDADERATPQLAKEIKEVISMENNELVTRKLETEKRNKLFIRHQQLIEQRDGSIGKQTGEVVAFFLPRVNYFLGKPLIHGGVYPDGQIRLVKRGKAHFPAKSVHEQMQVKGEVVWLFNDLEHHDSPTLKRYLERMNRYTDLHAKELQKSKTPKNPWYLFLYTVHRPLFTFLNLYFRHLGFLDGIRGFLWSFFSAMHYPLAYYKYWTSKDK
jgi:glycosyltransferase involved in cell wall biosynthesis